MRMTDDGRFGPTHGCMAVVFGADGGERARACRDTCCGSQAGAAKHLARFDAGRWNLYICAMKGRAR
jgi:hypothetical protein